MPPVKVRMERQGYKRLSIDDLGLNIAGNGSELIRNSVHVRGQGDVRHFSDRISLSLQAKRGTQQGIVISDGKRDALLPFISGSGKPLQPTIFVYQRIVSNAGLNFDDVNTKIKQGKTVTITAKIDDWHHAINTAERLGQLNSAKHDTEFMDIDQDYNFNLFLLDIVKGI